MKGRGTNGEATRRGRRRRPASPARARRRRRAAPRCGGQTARAVRRGRAGSRRRHRGRERSRGGRGGASRRRREPSESPERRRSSGPARSRARDFGKSPRRGAIEGRPCKGRGFRSFPAHPPRSSAAWRSGRSSPPAAGQIPSRRTRGEPAAKSSCRRPGPVPTSRLWDASGCTRNARSLTRERARPWASSSRSSRWPPSLAATVSSLTSLPTVWPFLWLTIARFACSHWRPIAGRLGPGPAYGNWISRPAHLWSGAKEFAPPQAETTFQTSKLRWSEADEQGNSEIRALYTACLRLRRAEAIFQNPERGIWRVRTIGGVLAIRWAPGDGDWLLLVRLWTAPALDVAAEILRAPSGRPWRSVLHSEEPPFGGGGRAPATPAAFSGLGAWLLRSSPSP